MASSSPYDSGRSLAAPARNKRRGAALSCAECRAVVFFRAGTSASYVLPTLLPNSDPCTTATASRKAAELFVQMIGELATRVRQLEDALSESHRQTSMQPHPLLSDQLLQIKRPLERERLDVPPIKEEKPENADTIDAMGSLSISHGGRSTFFGQTANSWYLLRNEEGSDEEKPVLNIHPSMPSDLPWLAHAFPFSASVQRSAEDVRVAINGSLPSVTVARRLCDVYYRHAAWMYTPISDKDFNDTIFQPLYSPAPYQEPVGCHGMSVFYMILALGTLVDLDRPSHSTEAAQYYQLARAALAVDPVFDQQSIPAIQALLLMCHYLFWEDVDGSRWIIMGMVVKLAQSVGLHRDSGKWKLDPDETYRRRCLLWEIFTYDSWQSLTFGRPPSFSLAHIDSQRPHETVKNSQGEVEMSFAAWKHGFCAECLSVVHDEVFGAHPPSYRTIQEMDKKVRTHYTPPSLQVPGFGGARLSAGGVEQTPTEVTMQRYTAFAIKEISLFYMHRGFFARALEDNPQDPMASKYAPSVLAAYTSACSFVGLIGSLWKQHPALTERMWFLFTHVFSCAIVLGSIAAKSQMAIAPSALSHLDSSFNLFNSTSETARKNRILPVLEKLRERARIALSTPRSPQTMEPGPRSPPIKKEEEGLAALGGMTRLVPRKSSSTPSTPSYSSSSPISQSASPPPLRTTSNGSSYQPMTGNGTNWSTYPSQTADYNVEQYSGQHYSQGSVQPESPTSYDMHQAQHLTLDAMPEYYGYSNIPSYQSEYSQYNSAMSGSNDFLMPSDVTDSWHNLMAQYKM
ncbi:hypothetical protein D9758_005988 [Tetrapyrgos nigripes]|uniref:Xylanolytic transcriptional activator regulatory domain-containing protein n=1 Tax=Tetrapyrgos nigripes TaxID=182062 RepID=A0A8H5D7Y6_9AGAR|nr:hypothetical protein D9758_005988 [Tetrapyrgos nigripes]